MKYLFFDCSAAGKPINYSLPPTDTFNWPRLTHLAWLIMSDDKRIIEEGNFVIKPEGFEISEDAERMFGLTQAEAEEHGVPLKEALEGFSQAVEQADLIFSHNLQFNENVVAAEMTRLGMHLALEHTEKFCLMRESTYYCKIPGRGGKFKWPSLPELYATLFGKKYMHAGNAYIDVKVTAASFFALKDRGMLEDLLED